MWHYQICHTLFISHFLVKRVYSGIEFSDECYPLPFHGHLNRLVVGNNEVETKGLNSSRGLEIYGQNWADWIGDGLMTEVSIVRLKATLNKSNS